MISTALLLLLFTIFPKCGARLQEPSCSYMDNLEKLLEKYVRNEHRLSIFGDTLTEMKQKLQTTLKEIKIAENERDTHIMEMAKTLNETVGNVQRRIETKESEIDRKLTDALAKHEEAFRSLADNDRYVGFTVHTPKALNTTDITFTVVVTNEGSRYDTSTGTFTADTSGFYFFSLALLKDNDRNHADCEVRKNGIRIAAAHVNPGSSATMPTSTTVHVHLDVEDIVTTRCGEAEAVHVHFYSSFTGYLAHADV